jgi:alkylated DNA repair dioxygenase AlkB
MKNNQLDFFAGEKQNLLPFDGAAVYHGTFLTAAESSFYFDQLLHHIAWRQDEVVMFGKRIITQRKVAWYGDTSFSYTYSHTTKEALPWTPALLELKRKAEDVCQANYNSCLLNLYHHGGEGMGWHTDNEDTLVPRASIASISLGAARKFSLKHKATQQTVSVMLANGSLLEMKEETQEHWLHALPKTKTVTAPRINLTFRHFREKV